MIRRILIKKKSERGQSFVELAISLVFLLVLLATLIDLGWAFYTLIALRDAAQEAALFASMCPLRPNLPDYPDQMILNDTGIMNRLRNTTNSPIDIMDIPSGDIHICVIDPGDPPDTCADLPTELDAQIGYAVRVEATIHHDVHVPFAATFIGRTTYPLSVDVSDTIMRLNEVEDPGCRY